MAIVKFFIPHLINPPTEDPGVYLRIFGQKSAFLVDCGNNARLSTKDLQRVSHVFISHTHIDHFIGLDNLIRANVHIDKTIYIYGPQGIVSQVHNKFGGYTWNLRREYGLEVEIMEIAPKRCQRGRLSYRDGFACIYEQEHVKLSDNIIVQHPQFHVQYTLLQHKIPCLAYAFIAHAHWKVSKKKLAQFPHRPGPWIKCLKRLLTENGHKQMIIDDQQYSIAQLRKLLLIELKEQKISYVTDTIYNSETATNIAKLAYNSTIFFCEAHFMQREQQKARETYHLTTQQAGTLARRARVSQIIGFHYSPKYVGRKRKDLEQEIREAFYQDP